MLGAKVEGPGEISNCLFTLIFHMRDTKINNH